MLDGESLKGCTPKAARRYATQGFQETSDNQEGQAAKFHDQGRSQGLPALFRSPAGLPQRDYYTLANHDGLQGVRDPRRPIGMTASPTARTSVYPATLGGPTKVGLLFLLKRIHPLLWPTHEIPHDWEPF
jgi:hypothetical protein